MYRPGTDELPQFFSSFCLAYESARQSRSMTSWGPALTLSPCRTVSSVRMSKVLNSTPALRSAATVLALKPHLGASGVPFMNSSTGADASRVRMRAVVSALCCACAGGAFLGPAEDACLLAGPCENSVVIVVFSVGASAPSISASSLLLCTAPESALQKLLAMLLDMLVELRCIWGSPGCARHGNG